MFWRVLCELLSDTSQDDQWPETFRDLLRRSLPRIAVNEESGEPYELSLSTRYTFHGCLLTLLQQLEC